MQRNYNCRAGCPVCGGIGYVKDERGKVVACPNVSSRLLYPGERYGLSEEDRCLTWEKTADINGMEAVVAVLRQVLARGAGFVYLWGNFGTGKTQLLKTAVALSLEAHREAAYVRMVEIFDHLQAGYNQHAPAYDSAARLDWWASLPLLAIDEFDRLKYSEYRGERRFLLMDRRYERALSGDTITIMAANEDPANLDGYLYDRIRDGRFHILHIDGQSARPAMGEE